MPCTLLTSMRLSIYPVLGTVILFIFERTRLPSDHLCYVDSHRTAGTHQCYFSLHLVSFPLRLIYKNVLILIALITLFSLIHLSDYLHKSFCFSLTFHCFISRNLACAHFPDHYVNTTRTPSLEALRSSQSDREAFNKLLHFQASSSDLRLPTYVPMTTCQHGLAKLSREDQLEFLGQSG